MENKTSINHENGNDANRLLCAVASEEFVEDFTSDGELTPIDIVAEITGLTYAEIRSCSKIVRVPQQLHTTVRKYISVADLEAINFKLI